MTVCMVAVEDDFTGGGVQGSSSSSAPGQQPPAPHYTAMNPQQQAATQHHPAHHPQYGGGYQGYQYPGQPYQPAPYQQPSVPQPPTNGAGPGGGPGPGPGALYGNQNSPLYNQNQSSSGYSYSGPGGGAPFPSGGHAYYNNHSPTHWPGAGQPPVRLSPPPLGGMLGPGARIPHPGINSPNQNVVSQAQAGNQMKTDNMDLKAGPAYPGQPAPAQGFSAQQQSGYGYNGYSGPGPGPGAGRPLVSPMSPRLNISPVSAANLSPHDSPGTSHLYPGQQPSPGTVPCSTPGPGPQQQYHGSYQAQYEAAAYFSKAGHSPLYGQQHHQDSSAAHSDNTASDSASVRSGEGGAGETTSPAPGPPSLTALLPSVKKEVEQGGDTAAAADKHSSGPDSDIENKFTPKSEPEDVKPEGSYYEEHKDFTLKANQTLIDNMNIDSIPELPEIPELKYEDMSEMTRLQEAAKDQKDAAPGLSPDCKDGVVAGRAPWEEAGEEEGYHDPMGWGGHMQEGMDQGYGGHQLQPYPNQQQMWANFYGSGGGPPGGGEVGGPRPGYPPHLQPGPGMEPPWWQPGHPAPPDLGPYRLGGPPGPGGPGMPPAPGPWALRGPRPRGERRGPGRPRLTNKGGERPRSAGLPGAQFPSPYPDTGPGPGLPDMLGVGDHKRGPGRPKAMLDPNSPKVPGDTTKNGNKKRYTCEVCQKRFSTAWYVRVHRRSHNGERPYVCNNCGKGFMLPNVLQVHLRKCEKNNPPGGGGGPGPQPSLEAGEAPNQSPNSSSGGGAGAGPGFPQQHPGYSGPAMAPGPYNQRYLGGPVFGPGDPPGPGMPPLAPAPGSFPGPGDPAPYPGLAPPPPHSPQLERSPPGPGAQFSPMYSPNSNLPISSDSEHHFLANDKPRDKGGGAPEANTTSAPPGADPSLYSAPCETSSEDKSVTEDHLKHRPFSCEMCDKRFTQKCNLVTHMRLHTGDKPYKCEFCDKRFTQKGNLDAHIKTHTKEKPFQCTLCPKTFAFKSSLQAHHRGHQTGCPDLETDEDLDSYKENAKMTAAELETGTNGGLGEGDSCPEDEDEEDQDQSPPGPGSVSPPPLPQFGATIQQFNSKGLNSSPENDISKLTDTRQTVAMLQ